MDKPTEGVIYGVRLRTEFDYRYIGLTTKSERVRLRQHFKAAGRGRKTPFYDWLRKQDRDDVVADVLDCANAGGRANPVDWASGCQPVRRRESVSRAHALDRAAGKMVGRTQRHIPGASQSELWEVRFGTPRVRSCDVRGIESASFRDGNRCGKPELWADSQRGNSGENVCRSERAAEAVQQA